MLATFVVVLPVALSFFAGLQRLKRPKPADHLVPEARRIIEAWRIDYNLHRPHSSLGGLAPTVYANRNRSTRPASLELRNGSAQRALTATTSQERNMIRLY